MIVYSDHHGDAMTQQPRASRHRGHSRIPTGQPDPRQWQGYARRRTIALDAGTVAAPGARRRAQVTDRLACVPDRRS